MVELEVCWCIVPGLGGSGPSVGQVFHGAMPICRHPGHDEVRYLPIYCAGIVSGSASSTSGTAAILENRAVVGGFFECLDHKGRT